MALSVLAPTRTLILAVDMTQLYWNCLHVKRRHCNKIDRCHNRRPGYGDTDHPNNDSQGDKSLPLPYT
jgi:7-cyano-7-deazaguanine synthase in queuosine biosynthesis